jgi:hypothetical protein
MPHIVLNKKINLEEFSNKFQNIFQKDLFLIKIDNIFLDREKRCALVPAVVIDEKNQQFLIEIISREGKTTVRLYPGTDPEKTEGVKTSMGLVVQKIQEIFTGSSITKTNIGNYIPTT